MNSASMALTTKFCRRVQPRRRQRKRAADPQLMHECMSA
jgi:hypothetical protein